MNRYLFLALALSLAYNVAIAEDGSFTTLDSNADGLITAAEALTDAKLVENFTELDVNGDGFLSHAEYSAAEASPEE